MQLQGQFFITGSKHRKKKESTRPEAFMSSQMKQQEIMLGPSTSATEVKISEEKDLKVV